MPTTYSPFWLPTVGTTAWWFTGSMGCRRTSTATPPPDTFESMRIVSRSKRGLRRCDSHREIEHCYWEEVLPGRLRLLSTVPWPLFSLCFLASLCLPQYKDAFCRMQLLRNLFLSAFVQIHAQCNATLLPGSGGSVGNGDKIKGQTQGGVSCIFDA